MPTNADLTSVACAVLHSPTGRSDTNMQSYIATVLAGATLLISGCATATSTYTPDGRQGYAIDCSGSALNWGLCFQKAGEQCGSRGYDVVAQTGDQGSIVSANQFGLYGGSVVTRSLVVACKNPTPDVVAVSVEPVNTVQ